MARFILFLFLPYVAFNPSSHAFNKKKVVEGDVFLLPFNSAQKITITDKDDAKFFNRIFNTKVVREGDLLVEVWATSRDEDHEYSYSCPGSAKEGQPERNVHECGPNKYLAQRNYWRTNSINRANRQKLKKLGKSDHWAFHGHPKIKGPFPKFFPAEILKDKKEGDLIKLKIGKTNIVLKCNQLDYRYFRFGRFEQAFNSTPYSLKDSL